MLRLPHTLCSLVLVALLAALAGAAPGGGKGGKVFLTQEEALELAFPKAEVKRSTEYLTEEELGRAAKLAGKGVKVERRVVYVYEARQAGKLVGTAYFDAHKVRTMQEVLMFTVDTAGRIGRVEILSFAEPLDYIPRGNWYAQFKGRVLDDDLRLKKDIKGVTGATLTARATTAAARRTLALHTVLTERAEQQERKKDGRGGTDGDGKGSGTESTR